MNLLTFKLTVYGIVLTVLAAAWPACSADPKIVEAAKKEGKLVAYVSMLTENAAALLAEFRKKYPFIDTSLYRANTQKLLPKIQLEARTQQHEADVISATFTIWNELTRGKLIMKYDSPERAKFPAALKDADSYWNILHLGVQGMAYNTRMVAPEIAPKSYEDLLHPRWRPKQIAMDFRDSSWMAVMLEIMGDAEGIAFMKKLAAKDLYMRENKNLLTQLLAAGEFPVLANTYLETFSKIQKSGAPIEWVPGRNPIPASTHLLGIYAHARHPNAAKLFVDFLLSREGQSLTANVIGSYPANPEVESELRKKTAGYRLHPVNPKMMSRF
ncbi:MAG TPA: extracellular solute-binding protein, partial [Candidatus Limnocylindrales bacterium]|nr:extracellular solute-binding protein [Candidatus Limnocylindrales bacterium]